MFAILNLPFVIGATTETVKNTVFNSGFLITVAIIVFSTLLIAFITHLKKDKCLKNLRSDMVTVYFNDGRMIKGRFDVENTGSEIIFTNDIIGEKRSQIIYKDEYDQVRVFARYYNDMDPRRSKELNKNMKKTYHPNIFRRLKRSILIFFKIINDSLMDIFSALSGRIKTANPGYANNEAYISKVNKEAINTVDATYNPLLEKYIGNHVICSHVFNGAVYECRGIIKDYSASYLELLDAKYSVGELDITGADIVLPRSTTKVRHLAENAAGIFDSNHDFHLKEYKKKIKESSHDDIQKAVGEIDQTT